jgi:hypothetical protein
MAHALGWLKRATLSMHLQNGIRNCKNYQMAEKSAIEHYISFSSNCE